MRNSADTNYIYSKLVESNNDMVGVFAYKRHKIETITKFEEKHGESPTDDDLKPFHEFSNGAMQLAMYREEGNQVVATFLNEMLEIAVEKEVSERIIPELSKIVSSELKKNKQSFMFGVWGLARLCCFVFDSLCRSLCLFVNICVKPWISRDIHPFF